MKKCYSTGALTMTVGAMLLGGAVSASALEVKSGNDNVQLNLYGHINRAVMSVDDGNETKIFHVDNTNSESRIGINGEVAAYDSLTIGGNVEVEWQSNPSHKVSMQEESISSELKERKMEVYFDSEKIGKLSIGRGIWSQMEARRLTCPAPVLLVTPVQLMPVVALPSLILLL